MGTSPSLVIERPPQTDNELWELVRTLWGITIPRTRVCPQHCAPFEAFAEAYFARARVSIWKASRALAGKSTLMAILSSTESAMLQASVSILGGSGTQSRRVIDEMDKAWRTPLAPKHLLAADPGEWRIRLRNGIIVEALTASQASARGPHKPRVRMDEVDEMDVEVMKAALGQAMMQDGVPAQTVLSSTHQYADGSMSAALKMAAEKGWAVREWCYKETLEPHGWLTKQEMEGKKHDMPASQWFIEVELQEPAAEGRAIQPEAVERMFDPELGEADGLENQYLEFVPPDLPHHVYATGSDWAKDVDWTVIPTFDATELPWVLVAFERMGRRPWPYMIGRFETRVTRYPGAAGHDAIAVGDVVHDLLSVDAEEFKMMGGPRRDLFTEYIVAIEQGKIRAPRIKFMYNEHKYCTTDDLYGSGHPPDSVVAGAIAWRQRHRVPHSRLVAAGVGQRVAHDPDW